MGRAAVEGDVRLGGRRVRVSARADDAARDEHVDQLERAVELRRERHVRDATCGEEPFEQRAVGIAPCGRRMHAEPRGRDERPFEMRADHPRIRGHLPE